MTTAISRRDWLRFAAAAPLLPLSPWMLPRIASANAPAAQAKGKACILLFMNGGMNQHASWHVPKMEYPRDNVRPIMTTVPGIEISELFPRIASQMRHIALLRSMSTGVTIHEQGNTLMHTGYLPNPSIQRPAIGNLGSAQLGNPAADLPNFVHIFGGSTGQNSSPAHVCMPGYLPASNAPVNVTDPGSGLNFLSRSAETPVFDASARLLERFNQNFQSEAPSPAAAAHQAVVQKTLQLLDSNRSEAFDIRREPLITRERYGNSDFGRACLLARRLVENHVPFVEVVMNGLDDHGGPRPMLPRAPIIDQAISGLLADLDQRGMHESTLVVCLSEFGRPGPGIVTGAGFGHYARCWTSWLAGGGIRGGQVIGKTDDAGGEVTERPIDAPTLHATICTALGMDYRREYTTAGGRPITFLDPATRPIAEVL